MPTRNLVLSEHQQQLVETLVRTGRYQNASEVLREGLRLIEDRDRRLIVVALRDVASAPERPAISLGLNLARVFDPGTCD